MKEKTLSFEGVILCLYSIILIAIFILPYLKYNTTYKLDFFLTIPLLIYICFRYPLILKENVSILISIIFIGILSILVNYWMGIVRAINTSIIIYLCIFSYFICEVFNFRDNITEIRIIVLTIVVLLMIICFNTYKELELNPGVARLLAYGTIENEEINLYRFSNVGGFGFSYALGMINPYFIIIALNNKGLIKVISILFWLITYLFCIKLQYTTLIFLITFFSICITVQKIKELSIRLIIIFISFLILIILPSVLVYLSEHIQYITLAQHFQDIGYALQGEELNSSRQQIYSNLIIMFLNNPLFGCDLSDYNNMCIINESHSTFLGYLAGYGIIITGLFIYIYYKIFNCVLKLKFINNDIKWIYIMFIVCGVLNPITAFEINVVILLLIPMMEFCLNYIKIK